MWLGEVSKAGLGDSGPGSHYSGQDLRVWGKAGLGSVGWGEIENNGMG